MKVVVTGAGGQLGCELALWSPSDRYEVVGLTRHELDITSEASCRKVIASLKPDVVIHCAAYTDVDQAESDEEGAMAVNAAGSGFVAEAAQAAGAKLIYISTDYVFGGNGTRPYQVDDPVEPRTIYGKSKLAGETISAERNERTFVVRTSWVYGRYGANFVKTMLKLGNERDSLKVVSDQKGSPTYTKDLAAFLLELAETDAYGIYHASNSGSCTWYEFAKAIFEESGMATEVVPCTSEEFVRPAPRPRYSVMDLSRIREEGLSELPEWREALRAFLRKEQD
ncbi:dTDP-4-dehydrorhamnose reductase [Paenibacillus sp. D51F]